MRPGVRAAARLVRPASRASRRLRRGGWLTLVGWHRLGPGDDGLSTPVDVFLRQLEVLERWGATVLSLNDAARLCMADALPARAVALTFDDGYSSVVKTAWPLLRERSLPATLFVVTGYLDGGKRFPWDAAVGDQDAGRAQLATSDDVAAAAVDGLDIGSHTVSHRWLPSLGADDLKRELAGSRAAAEELLGRPVQSLAYPMGGWNTAVLSAAHQAGYTIGVTTDRGANTRRQNPLSLRRAMAPNSAADFALLLDGALTWLRPLDRWRQRGGAPW
ncbi:MAG TPA: polysaccharide deacetylase family protein [Acidothermaceae bacterium]|jgi:peptidoglycan/xylan/chitin deacetylase (PgdA/CDA1 family)